MNETPWRKHEQDADNAKKLASEAYHMGNMVTYAFWCRIEDQKRADARKAMRKQYGRAPV